MKPFSRRILILACALPLAACGASGQNVKTYGYKVEESVPHDVASYTQGLFFYDGALYESAGQYGESNFRKVDLKSGRISRGATLPKAPACWETASTC